MMCASITLPRSVNLSGDWEKQTEGELFFEPLRPPSFIDSPTGDEDDAVSQSSVDSSFRSRHNSDGGFVLAADLSSSESDAFVSSTPGASDTEGRREHLVDLRSLFARTGPSKLLPVKIPALRSPSARNSRSPLSSNPSSFHATPSGTSLPLKQRKETLQQLIVSVPLSVISSSHPHLLHKNTNAQKSKRSRTFKPKLTLRKYLNKQRLDKSRPASSSPPSVSLTVSDSPQVKCKTIAEGCRQPSEAGNSTLTWDLVTSSDLLPLHSSDILTPGKDRQPYVVTVDCVENDRLLDATSNLPLRTHKNRTPVDQVAAKLVESLRTKQQSSPACHPRAPSACQYRTTPQERLFSGDKEWHVSTTTSLITAQPIVGAPLPGNSSSTLVHPNINTFQSTLSFESLFSFYPPELVVVNGELTPARSLSLKGTISVPSNHPVYKWSFGKRIGRCTRKSQRKHRPKKIVK